MATYFSVTSAICDPNNLLALSLGCRLAWGMLCTLINTTIKYTPLPATPTPLSMCGPAHLARTINVTDTHANCALPALSYLIYSCNLHTCHGQRGGMSPRGRGCVLSESTAVHVSVQRATCSVHSTAECVCLMLLIDFQSQLTGPSHSASPQHALLCSSPHPFLSSFSHSRLPFLP